MHRIIDKKLFDQHLGEFLIKFGTFFDENFENSQFVDVKLRFVVDENFQLLLVENLVEFFLNFQGQKFELEGEN